MYKILLYSELLDNGGVEKLLIIWTSKIKSIRFDVLTRKILSPSVLKQLNDNGCEVFEISCGKYDYPAKIRYARSLFQRNKYDAVHIHTMFALDFWLCKVAKENGIKHTIVHSHNAVIFKKPTTFIVDRISKPLLRKYTTDFFACSKPALVSLFGKKKAVIDKGIIIRNCVDYKKFCFNEQIRTKIRNKLDIRDDDILLGTVGRLDEQKNYFFLLDLYHSLYEKNKSYKLIFVGDGIQRRKLEDYARKIAAPALFLGVQSDVSSFLSAMDCFILTSKFEGFPLVTLEAEANGVPCIVSSAVPDEAILSDLVERIYSFHLDEWENAIRTVPKKNSSERIKSNAFIEKCGYDSDNSAKDLEQNYIRIIESV